MDRSFPSCTTEHVHQQRQNGSLRDGLQRSNRVWICCCSLMKSWLIMLFLHKICTRPIGRLVSQFYSSLGCFYPSGTTGRVVSSNTGYIHISYHILDFVQRKKTKFTMEQPYMLPVLYYQYHGCWCSVDLRSQGISRQGIDPEYSVSSVRRVNILEKFGEQAYLVVIEEGMVMSGGCAFLHLNVLT